MTKNLEKQRALARSDLPDLTTLKSCLAALVVKIIADKGWTQPAAAAYLEVQQSRISDIKQAKLYKFSVDCLLEILIKLGYRLESEFTPQKLKKPLKISVVQK